MRTLICGSIAYDNIMVFPDRFKNHILAEKIHVLNVAFLVPEMRRDFGGCASNIAYNLKMLGGEPVMMATVGDDYAAYSARFGQLNLTQDHVYQVPDTFTAQAFITTDLDDNQITAFHPGAMNFSHLNSVQDAQDIQLGIVAPDGRDGMIQHAREFYEAGIPFVFDPGQGLPMYNGEELLNFIRQASYIALNDYEAQLLQDRTGHKLESLINQDKVLIITLGAQGSVIYADGKKIEIPCVKPKEIIDPTGCGDAYRAGLLYGIVNKFDWQTTGQLSSLMGSLKIAHRGGQNHQFTREEINQLYFKSFGAYFS
ncbi:MAG: carbohydrate kinase family protein [Nitrosomonas sp.]